MTPQQVFALLTLVADLYAQNGALGQEVAQLRAALDARPPAPDKGTDAGADE